MRKKVFKYGIIGLLVFLFGLFISILFGYGIITEYNDQTNGSYRYWILPIAILIFSLNFISLVLLIRKSSKTIIFLNVFYFLLLVFTIFGFVRRQFYLQIDTMEYDIKFTFISIVILIFLILIINKFRYKQVRYENIEEIGKHKE